MSAEKYIRVYRSVNIDEVKKHCLVVEEILGQCQNCKTPGINFTQHKTCPQCKTEFRYLATSLKEREGIVKILQRIKKESLAIEMIEKEDLDRATAKDALSALFRNS